MHLLSSTPAAEAIMRGRNATRRALRRAGDHAQSRLEVLRDGHVAAPSPEPGRRAAATCYIGL